MGASILIIDTKYYTEYKNEVGFVSNLGDFTPNLAGNVMENVKVIRTLDIKWSFLASQGNPVSPSGTIGATLILTRTSGNWSSDSFTIGDQCSLFWSDNAGSQSDTTVVITSLTANVLVATWAGFPSGTVNGWINASVQLHGKTDLTALLYNFGLLGNNESFNVQSKVSNNSQGYFTGAIGLGSPRSTSFVNMTKLGTFSDWITGQVRARYVSNPGSLVQRFEIEHTYTIVPYFLDGQLSNLQNNIIPPLLAGLNSLKYVFEVDFRTTLNNPNSAKLVQYEESLGSVGWFNESFNGFASDYTISSVTYEEKVLGGVASGILIGSETRIRVTLARTSGPFVGAERFGAYISYLPDQPEYTNQTLSTLKDNFIYDNALNFAGLAAVPGQDFITAISGTINGGGDLELIIDVEYSPTQKAFLSQKFAQQPTYFLLGIQGGDNTLTNSTSERVILLADVELYDQSPDISDLMHVTKLDIFAHDKQIGTDAGSTDVTSWVEDGLAFDFEYDLNLNLSAFQNSLEFQLVAFNPVTQQLWTLDTFPFSPATSIVSGGVQQIIENTTRNYILIAGDQFNEVIINVGSQAAGLQKYSGRFAQKISWQEWLANLNADTIFFNASEPNNNLNNKASNYSLLNGYEIRMAIFSNVSGTSPLGVSGATDYLFLSPTLTIFDYEEDGLPTPVWSCLIETFDVTGAINLGGAIQTGADTLFRVTWTDSNGPVLALTDLWGINRIEVTDQQGYAITEMSSINLPLPSGQQLLEPTGVLTLLDITLVGGLVVFECLIDGGLVPSFPSGTNFNLSSRIHHALNEDPNAKLTSPDNAVKDTSGTITSKVTAP